MIKRRTYNLLRWLFVLEIAVVPLVIILSVILVVLGYTLANLNANIITNMILILGTTLTTLSTVIALLLKESNLNFLYYAFLNVVSILLTVLKFFNFDLGNVLSGYSIWGNNIYEASNTILIFLPNIFLIKAIIGILEQISPENPLVIRWNKILIFMLIATAIAFIGNLTGGLINPTMTKVAELVNYVIGILDILMFVIFFKTLKFLKGKIGNGYLQEI